MASWLAWGWRRARPATAKRCSPTLNLCRQHYRAEARQVDFVSQSESPRREINSWVEDKTQNKIKDLIRQGDLTPLTRLVLCNAIYFKGNWAR